MFVKCDQYIQNLSARLKISKQMLYMLLGLCILFGLIVIYKLIINLIIKKYMETQMNPTIYVSAMNVTYQNWDPKLQASGSVRAINGVDVTTEIAGLVKSVHFTPGAEVKKGDTLIELNADSDIAHLQSLEALAKLALITYTRDKEQYKAEAISKQTLDTDEANLQNQNAQVAEQTANIAKKNIKAPFSGRLGINLVNLGQYVNPGDKIVTLQALDPVYVNFYVPQQGVPKLSKDQIVTITSDAHPTQKFMGKITTLDPKADPSTRNVQIEATIENKENLLLPGTFVKVEVTTGAPQQYLTVPQTAISFNPYGDIVYLIKEKKTGKNKKAKSILVVEQVFVTLGEKRGDQVAVLTGLKENDRIVTAGQMKLKNGSQVIVNNKVLPKNEQFPNVVNE